MFVDNIKYNDAQFKCIDKLFSRKFINRYSRIETISSVFIQETTVNANISLKRQSQKNRVIEK